MLSKNLRDDKTTSRNGCRFSFPAYAAGHTGEDIANVGVWVDAVVLGADGDQADDRGELIAQGGGIAGSLASQVKEETVQPLRLFLTAGVAECLDGGFGSSTSSASV